jgi:hypothetical protein
MVTIRARTQTKALGAAVACAALLAPGAAAGGSRASQVSAERLIYTQLDQALDFVGATHVDSAGALTWLSVAGGDSGTISCAAVSSTRFRCSWRAVLLQSYTGHVRVTFRGRAPQLVFSDSTCRNPKAKGATYPNLCALDPVPGMQGTES